MTINEKYYQQVLQCVCGHVYPKDEKLPLVCPKCDLFCDVYCTNAKNVKTILIEMGS